MKIVFLDAATMGDVSFDPIREKGELVLYDSSNAEEARERVADCDVLVVNKIVVDKTLIDSAPRLRLICEAATGVNNINVGYAWKRGIPVRNAVGYSTDSGAVDFYAHSVSYGKCSVFRCRSEERSLFEFGCIYGRERRLE